MNANLLNPDTLRANPDWASLPLFDRTEWKRVPFGEVVQNVNETEREPLENGIERFIGLEHLEPGSLHVRRWGNVADGTTFTRRCRAGQVLFGKRRAYQRKVAVAEFDAVVSGDIYVFAPKNGELIPELLPFLCMSDRFFEHAVGTSAGSLSPRTNWSSLANFEFDLPSPEQQRRLAEILWAVDEAVVEWVNVADRVKEASNVYIEEKLINGSSSKCKLEEKLDTIIAGKSVVGTNEVVGFRDFGVLKVSAVGANEFCPEESKRLLNPNDFLSKYQVKAGDFLITRCNTKELVGRVCIVPGNHSNLMLCDKTLKIVLKRGQLSEFYDAVLKSRNLRNQIEGLATGTGGAMKNISQGNIRALEVPDFPPETQEHFVRSLQKYRNVNYCSRRNQDCLGNLMSGLLNTIFS